jgi:hypothetical protein
MKIAAAILAQPQSETASLASSNASSREHGGNFAQMFSKSLAKSQGDSTSSFSTLAPTQKAPSDVTSAAVQLHRSEAAEPGAQATPFKGFGADRTPHFSPRALQTPATTTTTTAPNGALATNGSARIALATAAAPATTTATTIPFDGSGADSTPSLLSPASQASLAAAQDAGSSAELAPGTHKASPPIAAAVQRSDEGLARLRAQDFGDTSARMVITASAAVGGRLLVVEREASSPAPNAVPAETVDAADAARRSARNAAAPAAPSGSTLAHVFARIAQASPAAPVTHIESIGSDNAPHLIPCASHALGTTATVAATAPAPAPAPAPALATTIPLTGFRSDSTPHLTTPASQAPPTPAITTTAATTLASIATPAAETTQTDELASSSSPSLARATHDDSAAPKHASAPLAGASSRSAKPASAAQQPAALTTTVDVQPVADAKPLTEPATQPRSESQNLANAARAEERQRARDSADGLSAEPDDSSRAAFVAAPNATSPPLATFIAPNSAAPSSHIHDLRSAEKPSPAAQVQTPPTSDIKQTRDHAAAAAPAPTQVAREFNQNGLRAEAQAATTLPQAAPQVPLPVHTAATIAATSAAASDLRAVAHLPAQAAPLAAQAARDDGLSMTLLPHAAHMAIESPDGDLALHMRVRQGSAEITVGGSMAHLFDARGPEARAALAGEGLALGRFDSGQQSGGQQNQPAPELPEATGESPAAYRPHQTAPLPDAPSDGRIHVTA